MSGSIKEKLLLYRLKTKHDPDAFTELYDLYVKRIYRFVYFKVSGKEEAEDITSEVFLKAWNYIVTSNQEIKSFSGLLYRLARNAVIDMYRRKSTQPQTVAIIEDTEITDGGKWYEGINRTADTDRVIAALKKLKQEYQEVITLRHVDELTIEEIAQITGKGQVATRVTLHRALKKLQEILGE